MYLNTYITGIFNYLRSKYILKKNQNIAFHSKTIESVRLNEENFEETVEDR